LTMHNISPRLGDTPGRLRTPAPEIGEHTAEILGQLGVGKTELDALAGEGIVGLHGGQK
jgi:crotonobetainyl-CoA:carnitine CoA-transferase CaiB-like acyl-CoA transferase